VLVSGLEMRPGCECCDVDLPADEVGAVVCSFECTFCAGCAEHLDRACPTCGGALMPRPTRVGEALLRHPASAQRTTSPEPCPGRGYAGRTGPEQRLGRHAERARGERAELDALLDEVLSGTLCTVVDGRPWVVPMLFARDEDRVLLHGSTGAGALRQVAAGAPAVLSVTVVDALVVAHSTFDSSANYRSAVVHGELTPLEGEDRTAALTRISERLIPGRTSEVRPMTRREEAATLAMALPITAGRWLLKARSGGPSVPEEGTDAWCGVVPLRVLAGAPEPAPWTVAAGTPVPVSVTAFVERVNR
jgi:nitroimidazol reductase NimA-like FMN-containing flavoprotein (pyridoxamine 5'-phosphate oxidase superfamily)